jgi:two-component system response regulator RegA
MSDPLLIVEDDAVLAKRLEHALQKRGFAPIIANSCAAAKTAIAGGDVTHALIDLRLADGSGLDLVPLIRARTPSAKIVILTGYGNIATAVVAIKAGAVDYLAKPAEPDAIEAALRHAGTALPPPPEVPMSAERVKWEHIQRVYHQCGGNISETARKLNMHRRSLQRILQKYAPQEHNPS